MSTEQMDLRTWLEERETIREATTECWTHDAEEDGSNFWAGGGRFDFHLTLADAAFCVDAHNTLPKLLAGVKAVLRICDEADEARRVRVEGNPTAQYAYATVEAGDILQALQEAINDEH